MRTSRRPHASAALGLALAACTLAATPSAQVLGRTEGRQVSGEGYYLYAVPDEPTIRVAVQGDVPRTGVYDLGRGFDLSALLAMAGGPSAAAAPDPRDPRDLRDPEVRIRLRRGAGREVAYEVDYDALVTGAAAAPDLADGDVVLVETVYERGVYVWGAVRNPGFFEVGPDVDAVRLLALAGGPQGDGARAQDVVTDATVAVIRPGAGVVYQASLEAFVIGTDVPDLADGDALQVEVVQRNRFTFRDGLSVVGSLAGVASVVLTVVVALTRSSN